MSETHENIAHHTTYLTMPREDDSRVNFFLRDFILQKKLYMKNFNIKNKDNKISQGRGNSVRNEVRCWVELGSPDPLKPLPAS